MKTLYESILSSTNSGKSHLLRDTFFNLCKKATSQNEVKKSKELPEFLVTLGLSDKINSGEYSVSISSDSEIIGVHINKKEKYTTPSNVFIIMLYNYKKYDKKALESSCIYIENTAVDDIKEINLIGNLQAAGFEQYTNKSFWRLSKEYLKTMQ